MCFGVVDGDTRSERSLSSIESLTLSFLKL